MGGIEELDGSLGERIRQEGKAGKLGDTYRTPPTVKGMKYHVRVLMSWKRCANVVTAKRIAKRIATARDGV